MNTPQNAPGHPAAAKPESEFLWLKMAAIMAVAVIAAVLVNSAAHIPAELTQNDPLRHAASDPSASPPAPAASAATAVASAASAAPAAAAAATAPATPAGPSTAASAASAPAAAASQAGGAAPSGAVQKVGFKPPAESDIPDGPLGDVIRKGEQIFLHTGQNAKPFVGNTLNKNK